MKNKFIFVLSITILFNTLLAKEPNMSLSIGYYLPSISDTNLKDIKISLNFWASEVSKNSNINLKSYFYKNIKKLKSDLKNKKIDLVTASTLVLAKDFKPGTFQDGFKSIGTNPKAQNRLLLLIQKDKPYKKLKDLRHKTIARIANQDIESLYLNVKLQESFHQNANQFFKKNIFLKNYAKAILKLFFKKADVALVTQEAFDLASELNPQIKKRLKVIDRYDVKLITMGLFRKDVSKNIIDKFMSTVVKLHLTPRGKQILTIYKADHIISGKVSELISIKKLYRKYLTLTSKKQKG